MKRTDNKEEHLHNGLITSHNLSERESNFRLYFVSLDVTSAQKLGDDKGYRDDRENDEEEDNVVTVQKVI